MATRAPPAVAPGAAGGSTTVTNLGVAMFSVADQDAALAFYTDEQLMDMPGVPKMFALRDPDGNNIWVVDA